ncbi:AAA family ATPase [Hyalangium rubrum]|uniref:AAA family ATPase n=1 Tax=Hyalangium rubrum TaxID=3103134 RepID=A0ABU5HH03_9BACT|nr:AAA family ATPase [Hyalangium sp. s54d21]MDY7232746.1 AAA family ATPase [Hyalangium sp. s54d21]
MKILAIRGRNLTSLSGDFALELDQAPLDKLGLFAITGATGSGKSTLLDAMCLALFDRTPRLEGRGGVPVVRPGVEEEDPLLSHDVRGVLRRGAAEGFAEVDFLGKDGRRYRARWLVRRARNKAEGRFQPQELSLTDVEAGQAFGRTKSEVLKAIEQKLGLSFDQFRRSALLAQGDFAAFLRANASERAELLERMTGTEVYSQLSIAAYERHKAEQTELGRREAGLAAISRLTDEERVAAEGTLASEETARVTAEGVLAAAVAAAEWYSGRAKLVEGEREASVAQARAAEAVEAAAPREVFLSRVRAAEAFRAPVVAVEKAERGLTEASAAQVLRASEAEAALATAGARKAELARAEKARAVAVAAEETAAPALAEAARLDAQLVVERREALETSQRAEASRAAEKQQRTVLAGITAQEAAARTAAEGAQAWLAGHAHLEPLAREWPRWEAELIRHERSVQAEQQARAQATRLGGEKEKLRAAAELRRQERQSAADSTEMAQATATHAEAAVGEDSGAARRAQRESLLARQEALRTLGTAREGAVAEATTERDVRAEAEAALSEAEAAGSEARGTAARLVELNAELKEAGRALARAQAAQGLSSYRAALQQGEPCPLCGAKEHPYGSAEAALDGLVVEATARVKALEAEKTEATRTEAAASAREKAARPRQAKAEARRAEAAMRLTAHRQAWQKARSLLEQPLPPEEPEDAKAQAWLQEALKEAQERLVAVRAEEEAAEARARKAKEARAALETWRARLESAVEAQRRAEDALAEAERALRQAEHEAEQAGAARRQGLTELAPAFTGWSDWEARLVAEPARFRKQCAEQVSGWNGHQEELRAAQAREAEARQGRAAAEAKAETLRETAEEHARVWTRANEALQATQAARGKVLAGRPTEEVRASLHAAVDTATQAHELARKAAESAGQAAAMSTARAEEAAKARNAAAEALEQAQSTLEALLKQQAVTREDVKALLARGAAWCEDEARALAVLREAQAKAGAVLEERRASRARHEASGPPSLPEPEVAAACERARVEVETRRTAAARCKARLDQDDDARRRHGAEAQALEERRRAAEVWKTLQELIGSADGKKFKVFAQSLTLDALLLHANTHLQELARRYRLMRVPGHDLDLQVVDQDMGDEIRGLASLSGGESFLVSLALALGLASLSSETTQVETLFIDEGFGTLDPETLEVALATLDALQATGRQVGIISHVSGLAERIGVQVRVVKQGGGRSRLVVEAEGSLALVPEPPAPGRGKKVA